MRCSYVLYTFYYKLRGFALFAYAQCKKYILLFAGVTTSFRGGASGQEWNGLQLNGMEQELCIIITILFY